MAALGSAKTFEVSDNRLRMFYEDGRSVLNFLNNSSPAPAEQGEGLMNPVALLTAYYEAVNGRDYERAYGHWETPPNNFRDFVRGYSDTLKVQVFVQQPDRIEGAAGSLYAEIPTILISRGNDNRERLFAGVT